MTSISVEIQSEWDSGIVQASKEWIHGITRCITKMDMVRFTGIS